LGRFLFADPAPAASPVGLYQQQPEPRRLPVEKAAPGSERKVKMLVRADVIYRGSPTPQGDHHPSIVTGCDIAHGKRTVPERALLAADLHLGRVVLTNPTVKQCAALAVVCRPYVAAAVVIADDQAARDAVLAGRMSLPAAAHAESLVDHFARSSTEQRLEVARTFGIAQVWDQLIVPLLD